MKQFVDKDLLPISVLVWNIIVVTDLVRAVWSSLLYLFIYLGEEGVEKKDTVILITFCFFSHLAYPETLSQK